MSQGGYVTLVGFVAQDPRQREVRDGLMVTDLRVGATTRVRDWATNEWRDGDTSYFDVSCWRRLGDHVRASLHKGDPVMVKGRFKSRTFTDKAGVTRTVIDIMADTVGHDLNRGIANYLSRHRPPVSAEEPPADDAAPDVPEGGDMLDAEAMDITAVPTFFINGRRHVGPYDAQSLIRALQAAAEEDRAEQPRATS